MRDELPSEINMNDAERTINKAERDRARTVTIDRRTARYLYEFSANAIKAERETQAKGNR